MTDIMNIRRNDNTLNGLNMNSIYTYNNITGNIFCEIQYINELSCCFYVFKLTEKMINGLFIIHKS